MNFPLLLGSLLGLSAMLLGAYFEHGLDVNLTQKALASLHTGLRYQSMVGLLITVIGLLLLDVTQRPITKWLIVISLIFSLGIIFFSFSIYAANIFSAPSIRWLTPVGGLMMMLGWLLLIFLAFKKPLAK